MVNRIGAVEEINLSDDEDGGDWSSYDDYYSEDANTAWNADPQGLEESTVWVDEMGNSYYEADNDHQSYVDGRNYAQEGDYYYDDSYQQGYDQNYYYDESQGAYVYYEDNSQYDYAYDSRSYAPSYAETARPMPTGLFQSNHVNASPQSRRGERHDGPRNGTGPRDKERFEFRAGKSDAGNIRGATASDRNRQRLQQRRRSNDFAKSRPFIRRGGGGGGGPPPPRSANRGVGVTANPVKSSSASASPASPVTLESEGSENEELLRPSSSSPPRRRRADDDSDEDPNFKTSFRKSELKEGGESRSLRSKGSPPPAPPILGHISRVSEGKVMARKRRKSSTKAKSATISASSTTGSSKVASAAPSPDLVCLDSDDSDDEDDESAGKSIVKRVNKNRKKTKVTHYRAKSQSLGTDGGAISAEICIDDSDDQLRVKSGGGAKKKRKHRFKDRTLVMPIHKYYYGWAEGEKTSNSHHMFRFRCSRDACQHVTYDNVGAMRHAISHVQEDDASLDADIFSELIRCPTCFLPFKSRYDMQIHFEKQHPAAATKSKGPHRCKICERDLNGQEKFVQHMRQYHVRCDMPYVCPICFYRSSIYNMVVDHFLAYHNNVQEALCPYCLKCFAIKPAGEDEKFGDTSDYMSHLTEHTITKRHKCQQCRLNFVKGNHLSTHAQCDHKTAKGEIKEIEASMIADHVPVTVSEATSKHHDEVDGTADGSSVSSASEHPDHRSQAILASFVMTLGQRAGPQSLTAEGLKAWNLQCKECHRPFDFAGHFRTATSQKFVQCNKCKFITTCSFSYAKHMIFFHGTAADRGKIVPSERKVKDISVLRCRDPACDFETEFGNKMAAHMMKLKHFAGGCAAEKTTEKGDNDDDDHDEHEKCESSRELAESDAAEYTHLLESTLEIDSDSDSSDDDADVKDDSKKYISTEVVAREILDEILAHIDPVGAVIHALVADVEAKQPFCEIIDDDDEREDNRRSDDDVAIDEVSDDSDASPKSPEIIALSDTDGDDD